MKVNDIICGFEVVRARENAELGGTLWEMRHTATGARLAWMDNGESNKLFSIAFKTLPWNDTGVFHILEHTVLNGSKAFPVREPFVNLLKSSMNTFLNAITFQDKTMFPVASRNEQDFLNLTKVYLDAVFCPAIYENKNIFLQEGWHYVLEEGGEPSYNGVVFNEMKGAYSSPDSQLYEGIGALLFPDSSYGYSSGGDPAHIPELSYEEFLSAHRDFYSPANCYVYLDGAVPLEKVLDMVAGYLTDGRSLGKAQEVVLQKAIPYTEKTQYYEGKDDGDALLMTAQRIGTWEDRQKLMALDVLCKYLTGSNDAPLKKAILESRIAQDAALILEDSIAMPYIALQVRQMDGKRKDELMDLVRGFLANHKVNKEDLQATIDQMEFAFRDAREPAALMRNITAMNTWLFGGDMLEGMTVTALFEGLRKGLEGGYFDALLQEVTFAGENAATLLLLPSSKKGEQMREEEAQRLREAAAKWTDADRQAIIGQKQALSKWQAAPDSPEQLKTLPVLPIDQISGEVTQPSTQIQALLGCPVLCHQVGSGKICHYGLYFSLADKTQEELQALSFLTKLLGKLPTVSHDLSQLQRLQKSILGRVEYKVAVYQDPEDGNACKPYFVVAFSALAAKEQEALALIAEILLETSFLDQSDAISVIAAQGKEMQFQSILTRGDQFASLRARSHLLSAAAMEEKLDGYDFYCWLKDLAENFTDRKDDLQAQLAQLSKTVFCSARVTVSMAGGACSEALEAFLKKLPAGEGCAELCRYPADGDLTPEAILIPAQVSYAAASGKWEKPYHGGMDLMANIMNFDYLWNEIRVKGGAYGCRIRTAPGGNLSFSSYRDPSPCNSLKVFASAADFIDTFCKEDNDLTQYIIGAAGSQDPLLSGRDQANRAMNDYFMGTAPEVRNQWRQELLAMKQENLLSYAAELRSTQFVQCIVGCKEAIGENDGWKYMSL